MHSKQAVKAIRGQTFEELRDTIAMVDGRKQRDVVVNDEEDDSMNCYEGGGGIAVRLPRR